MIYNGAGKMYGVGEGLERGAGHILNAVMMKKRLEMAKQAADTESLKTQAEVRRSDAYTSYLNNQDILKQLMAAHDEVPAWLERKQMQTAGRGPGSTANQLATRYAAAPGVGTALPVVAARGGSSSPPSTPQKRYGSLKSPGILVPNEYVPDESASKRTDPTPAEPSI